jgi:hypothetical protein
MNAAHLHLFLTHAPIFGTLFGVLILLLGAVRKSDELKRLGLWLFILTALLVLPTYLTGSPASGQMKKMMPTMPMETADQHEEIAIVALVAVLFVGILSIAGVVIFSKSKAIPGWFIGLVLAMALLSTGALAWTANLGGKIRHTEIRAMEPLSPASMH